MSASTVVTMGYGSFGSVNFLPTLGYSSSVTVAAVSVEDGGASTLPQRRTVAGMRVRSVSSGIPKRNVVSQFKEGG